VGQGGNVSGGVVLTWHRAGLDEGVEERMDQEDPAWKVTGK
jgi:hypothetical protein